MGHYTVIVLDFETTACLPRYGDRAIEIGAVHIENNRIIDSFQSLMNPGFHVNSFITSYTGISNAMLQTAPPCEKVLAARRIYPNAPNHKMGTLVDYCDIETDGTFHRVLADAEMTGRLWIGMINDIKTTYGLNEVPFGLMQKITKTSKAKTPAHLSRIAKKQHKLE